MLARSLEQVFAWRRVAGSVRRLRGSGGERRRFGTGAHREVRVARGRCLAGRACRLPPRSGTTTDGTRRPAPRRFVASELGTPDRDVGRRGLLEPPDGVLIELALDPRPRAGYRSTVIDKYLATGRLAATAGARRAVRRAASATTGDGGTR